MKNKFFTLKALLVLFLVFSLTTVRASIYYSNSSALNNLTAWWTNTNGTGSHPSSFTTLGDIFILQVGQTCSTTGNWVIGAGVTLQINGILGINGNNSSITINGTVIFTDTTATQITLAGAGSGNDFNISSGAFLKTNNVNGIQGANCSLPVNESKKTVRLNTAGNYEFNGTSNQKTLGLPNLTSGGAIIFSNISGIVTLSAALSIAAGATVSINAQAVLATGFAITATGSLKVNGTLQINTGGTISAAPVYGNSSTLKYNTAGTVARSVEWSAITGNGYPNNVQISNNTMLNLGNGGTATARQIAGDLIIDSGSTLSMNVSGNVMTSALTISGNVVFAGSLILSGSFGGDINVGGNWTHSIGATFTNNSRNVTFNNSKKTIITAPVSTTRDINGAFGGETFYNLYINKINITDSVRLASNISITNELGFVKGSFNCNTGDITIVSNKDNTAHVAAIITIGNVSINYSDTGKFIIQRNLPMQNSSISRRWRLLSSPIKSTGAPTINVAWQEGVVNTKVSSPINPKPGYGTEITNGNTMAAVAKGFDMGATASPSIYYMNPGISPSWVVPSNTLTTPISAYEGYMIFVRGDRSIVISNQFTGANPTTLSVKGMLNLGNITKTLVTGEQVIGNPYASAISFDNVLFNGSTGNNSGNYYYYWDPKTSGSYNVGHFITVSNDGVGSPSSYTVTKNVSGITDGTIESGAAIVVESKGGPNTIVFHETDKITTSKTVGIASRPANVTGVEYLSKLFTNVYSVNTDGSLIIADAVVNVYFPGYSNTVDEFDAPDLNTFNTKENLGIARDGKLLAIERRNTISANDTIFLQLQNMVNNWNYKFEFVASNFKPGFDAYLEDSSTEISTPISLTGLDTTTYNFVVNSSIPSSANISRFKIVLSPSSSLPVTFTRISASVIEDNIVIAWRVENELNIKLYEVEESSDGALFTKVNTTLALGYSSMASYNWVNVNPENKDNYYRIKSIGKDGEIQCSSVVKIKTNQGDSFIGIYPNPIKNNTINLQFKNQKAGNCQMGIYNLSGQLVFTKTITVPQNTLFESILVPSILIPGIYQLHFDFSDGKKWIQKIIVSNEK